MSSFIHPIAIPAPFLRSVAIAVLMGATMLASPLTAARGDSAATVPIQLAQAATQPAQPANQPAQTVAPANQAAAGATNTGATKRTKGETVEQRIATLHKALKITPEEEPLWNAVAQAMRENAANMEKVVAANRATPPQNMTAMDDLTAYEKFAQAHVDGLKNLISAFQALYNAMPDDQKKVADQVFRTSARRGAASHN